MDPVRKAVEDAVCSAEGRVLVMGVYDALLKWLESDLCYCGALDGTMDPTLHSPACGYARALDPARLLQHVDVDTLHKFKEDTPHGT